MVEQAAFAVAPDDDDDSSTTALPVPRKRFHALYSTTNHWLHRPRAETDTSLWPERSSAASNLRSILRAASDRCISSAFRWSVVNTCGAGPASLPMHVTDACARNMCNHYVKRNHQSQTHTTPRGRCYGHAKALFSARSVQLLPAAAMNSLAKCLDAKGFGVVERRNLHCTRPPLQVFDGDRRVKLERGRGHRVPFGRML